MLKSTAISFRSFVVAAESAKGAIAQASRHGMIRAARRSSGVRRRTSAFSAVRTRWRIPEKGIRVTSPTKLFSGRSSDPPLPKSIVR